MQVENWNIDKLIPFHNNSRVHDEKNLKAINASIDRFNWLQPIVVDKDGVIIMGHGRREAALELGMTDVPVLVADWLTENEVAAAREADNMTQDLSFFDFEKLNMNLEEIDWLDVDMSEFGFKLDDELFGEAEEDDYTEEQAQEAPSRVQRGEIWQLGEHRLMCGDSTSETDVEALMGGGSIEADLLLTDPPYNVALGSHDSVEEARQRHRRTDGLLIENDSFDSEEDFEEFLVKAFGIAISHVRAGGSFYIWHADSMSYRFRGACARAGMQIRQNLIWNKNTFTLGRQDYQWRHEPCLYGWKDGAAHYFVDDRTQSTVLDYDKPSRSEDHPTMKPVALISKLIENSTKKNEIVLDVFGGSGTTLIASEQLKRKCYMMELDQHFCDVIIDRWENLTGEEAEKICG